MQLNAENLFLFLDQELPPDWKTLKESDWQALSKASVPNKPLKKTLALAEAVLDVFPHVVAVNEVGGMESLRHFNRLFLEDRYEEYLVEGNSDRGIDVGYLVRRDWKKKIVFRSHRERPIDFLYPHERGGKSTKTSHLFSRDCAELRIFSDEISPIPALILFVVHLKSKLDPQGIDPYGNRRRAAEAQALVKIYLESQKEFPASSRVVLGDFNGIARFDQREPEFNVIYEQTDLKNALELAGLEKEFSTTQVQFSRMGLRELLQFDYVFLSQDLHDKLVEGETFVYRYKNDMGIYSSLPMNFDEKLMQPSDHYPVVVTLEL